MMVKLMLFCLLVIIPLSITYAIVNFAQVSPIVSAVCYAITIIMGGGYFLGEAYTYDESNKR